MMATFSDMLREIADKIYGGKYDLLVTQFDVHTEVEEGEPEQDAEGKWWKTWNPTGETHYDLRFTLKERQDEHGNHKPENNQQSL